MARHNFSILMRDVINFPAKGRIRETVRLLVSRMEKYRELNCIAYTMYLFKKKRILNVEKFIKSLNCIKTNCRRKILR